MKNKIKKLIERYQARCNQIEKEWCTIAENGRPRFNYEVDYDDQVMTAEAESEYYTLLDVIDELKEIVGE